MGTKNNLQIIKKHMVRYVQLRDKFYIFLYEAFEHPRESYRTMGDDSGLHHKHVYILICIHTQI